MKATQDHQTITCAVCGGTLEPQTITSVKEFAGRVVIVRNVPALVCGQCGEKYYSPETVDRLLEAVKHGKAEKTETVPVIEFPRP